jgi:hypothetical protein
MLSFRLLLCFASTVYCSSLPPIVFSAGFTSGAVLQSDASVSVYGFVTAISSDTLPIVEATLTFINSDVTTKIAASIVSAGAGSTCDAACFNAGYLSSVGDVSPCQIPSCSMGCSIGASTSSEELCVNACKAAKGCTFDIPRRLGNWSQDMCEGSESKGGGCPSSTECESGCAFSFAQPSVQAWKATFAPQSAGGNATVSVSCTSGCTTTNPSILTDITFGLVYFCFGQSNLALFANNTYDFPELSRQVSNGSYSNLRLFQYGAMGTKSESDQPTWASTALTYPAWPWLRASEAIGYGGRADLTQFPATCLYFARHLIDLIGTTNNNIPIGLIATAVGGTSIEAWSDEETYTTACSNTQAGGSAAPPVTLFNSLTAPFVNTSISGWILYQGENNCGGTMGNSMTGSGYGCQLPALVASYRKWWSNVPNTTSPLAAFGVVTLAATTSEGNGKHMAGMRWSQTGNYGVLPNTIMPNTFIAQAYDLGDPWEMSSADDKHCSKPPRASDCVPWSTDGWDSTLLPLAPAVERDIAPSFMGGIHPRIKSPVGRRLAHALYHSQMGGTLSFTGPTIAGCNFAANTNGGEITVRFNTTLLRNEIISLGDWDSNMNNWGTDDSSGPMICFPSLGKAGDDCLTTTSMWKSASVALGNNVSSVIFTVTSAGLGVPSAIRYGWPLSDAGDSCCPNKNSTNGFAPCIPGNCPIKTGQSLLPANPFYANITAGTTSNVCACLLPQICNA